jgi:peptidyl-prolyl cis-trans isomerase C
MRLLPGLMGAILLAQPGCDRGSPRDSALVLARVGEDVIREADFRRELERRAGRQPIDLRAARARQHVLDEMIDARAQLARARELGLERDPDVQRELDAVLVRQLRARELEQKLQQIRISDEEIEHHFETYEDEFARPARQRAAIVALELPPGASEANRAQRRVEAEALLAEAETLPAGFHGFGPIAARVSSHRASRYKGGDIGWLVRDELRHPFEPALLTAIFSLETPGELGPIVEGERALYLVRLIDHAPRAVTPLEQVAPRIRQRLVDEGQQRVEREWLADLRVRAGVERDLERLAAIELPARLAAAPSTRRSPARLPDSVHPDISSDTRPIRPTHEDPRPLP